MHQQEGPFGVQPEQRGTEVLSTFRLAGVGGAIKVILNEKSLLLERRDLPPLVFIFDLNPVERALFKLLGEYVLFIKYG